MSLKKLVRRLYVEQGGKCFYCCRATWLQGVETKDGAAWRFGIVRGEKGAAKALRHRMATAEHLKRLADGGPRRAGNVVMACFECNNRREDMPVREYREMRARP